MGENYYLFINYKLRLDIILQDKIPGTYITVKKNTAILLK